MFLWKETLKVPFLGIYMSLDFGMISTSQILGLGRRMKMKCQEKMFDNLFDKGLQV